jgi:hypothetical protein
MARHGRALVLKGLASNAAVYYNIYKGQRYRRQGYRERVMIGPAICVFCPGFVTNMSIMLAAIMRTVVKLNCVALGG